MIYDAVIIGGGVVGLSILRASLLAGRTAILVERNADLCDGASGRNSGVLCTGADAPEGSLERKLIREALPLAREFCRSHNVPTRECGSLVCLWPWDEGGDEKKSDEENDVADDGADVAGRFGLVRVLRESHDIGDEDASLLTPGEVAALEPSLSSKCRGGVHIPGEVVVDPWLFCLALAMHSRELAENAGMEDDVIRTGREVVMDSSSFDADTGVWNVVTRRTGCNNAEGDDTVTINARCVINAAGIHCDLVQSSASSATGDSCKLPPPDFEARPRRGQYLIFAAPAEEGSALLADDDAPHSKKPIVPRTIPARPIQPVPSQFTKGIFVYSTLYDQVVVGPTARDQPSRSDDAPDADVARILAAHAARILGPDFDASNPVGEYVGIRPGTSRRDYQLHLHEGSKFITVGGIRSTGLTASLGIGRHVARRLLPDAISKGPDGSPPPARPTPLPDVKELVERYHERGDGRVVVGGHAYRVTHPLTRMGWDARAGLAA